MVLVGFLTSSTALVALLVTCEFLPQRYTPRFTVLSCHRLKDGMSSSEVEAILGGPPGDYRTEPTEAIFDAAGFQAAVRSTYGNEMVVEQWTNDRLDVNVIYFSENDRRVFSYNFVGLRTERKRMLDTLYWHVKRMLDRSLQRLRSLFA
jgi:hypothetical protein